MACFLAWLATLVAGDSMYYKLTNTMASASSDIWPYTRDTESSASCDSSLFIGPEAWADYEFIRESQCTIKCLHDPDAYGCYHFMSTDVAVADNYNPRNMDPLEMHCKYWYDEDRQKWTQKGHIEHYHDYHLDSKHPRASFGIHDNVDSICGNDDEEGGGYWRMPSYGILEPYCMNLGGCTQTSATTEEACSSDAKCKWMAYGDPAGACAPVTAPQKFQVLSISGVGRFGNCPQSGTVWSEVECTDPLCQWVYTGARIGFPGSDPFDDSQTVGGDGSRMNPVYGNDGSSDNQKQGAAIVRPVDGLLCARPEEIAQMCYMLEDCDAWEGFGLDLHQPDMVPDQTERNTELAGKQRQGGSGSDPVAGYFMFHRRRTTALPAAFGGDGMKDVDSDKAPGKRGVVARLVKKGCEGDKLYTWRNCDATQPDPGNPNANNDERYYNFQSFMNCESRAAALTDSADDAPQWPEFDWMTSIFYSKKPSGGGPSEATCPLGRGLELSGGPYSHVKGLYNFEPEDGGEPARYRHTMDGANAPYFEPAMAGNKQCGWALKHFVYTDGSFTPAAAGGGAGAGAGAGAAAGGCGADNDLALNFALEQCDDPATCENDDPDYQTNLCQVLYSVWEFETIRYCGDETYRRLCPGTCGVAAEDCAADALSCSTWLSEYDCTNPVKMQACPESCPAARRMAAAGKPASLGGKFVRQLQAFRAQASVAARKLQGGSYETVYKTCVESGADCACSDALDESSTFYDEAAVGMPMEAAEVTLTCSGTTQYRLFANKYCQYGNVDTIHNTREDIVENRCVRKCGDTYGDRIRAPGKIGLVEWCAGNNETLAADDLSLCLPREQCEAICNSLEECESIDMHRSLPRCYLNVKGSCPMETSDAGVDPLTTPAYLSTNLMSAAGAEADSLWDLLAKVPLPGAEDPSADALRTSFVTHTNKYCGENVIQADMLDPYNDPDGIPAVTGVTGEALFHDAGAPVLYVGANRAECEAKCYAEEACAGFQWMATWEVEDYADDAHPEPYKTMIKDHLIAHDGNDDFYSMLKWTEKGICQFFTYDAVMPEGELMCEDMWGDTKSAIAGQPQVTAEKSGFANHRTPLSVFAFVEKAPASPCEAEVAGLGGMDGTYIKEKKMAGDTDLGSFFRTDNKAKLEYVNDPCDGWMVSENKNAKTHDLTVCVDDPEAALVYFEQFEAQHLVDPIDGKYVGGNVGASTAFNGNSYSGKAVEDKKTFPCQWGFDHGWCDDIVFNGICAHTCQPINQFMGSTAKVYNVEGPMGALGIRQAYWRIRGYPMSGFYYYYEDGPEIHGDQALTGLYQFSPDYIHTFGDDAVETSTSSCAWNGDNHFAMWMFLNLTDSDTPGPGHADSGVWDDWRGTRNSACEDVAGPDNTDYYVDGMWPCMDWNTSSIVRALCRKTCSMTPPPDPPPAPAAPDEADPQGAAERRMMAAERRKLYTASWSGKMPNASTITYYERDDGDFVPTHMTYAASSTATCEDGTAKSVASYAMVETADFYAAAISTDFVTSAKVMTVCRNSTACPEMQTCAMTEERMYDELVAFRYSAGIARTTIISQLDGPVKDAVFRFDNWIPKVLTSPGRAEAIIIKKDTIPASMSRTAPGATRLMIAKDASTLGHYMDVVLYEPSHSWRESGLTLVSPPDDTTGTTLPGGYEAVDRLVDRSGADAGMDYECTPETCLPQVPKTLIDAKCSAEACAARCVGEACLADPFSALDCSDEACKLATVTDFGVSVPQYTDNYPDPAKWFDGYISDGIRIERFTEDKVTIRDGKFVFDVFMPNWDESTYPGTDIYALRFPPVPGSDAVLIESEGGSLEVLPAGIVRITVTELYGDFVILTDKNECAKPEDNFCDKDVGICTNRRYGYDCSCPDDYTCKAGPNGPCETCEVKQQSYDDFYIRLRHASRLDYGWRVDSVNFYSDLTCTTRVYPKAYCLNAADAVVLCTDGSECKAGSACGSENGFASDEAYPFATTEKKTAANLLAAGKKWWSECITCNPEEVDATHGGASALTFEFTGSKAVQCLKVEQGSVAGDYMGHASRELVVERGPMTCKSSCGAHTGMCQPTMTWNATCGSMESFGGVQDTCEATFIPLGCGAAGTVLFGEILEPAGTENLVFYGSYPSGRAGITVTASDSGVLVPSACHCHEMCLNYLDEGCRSYKYYFKSADETHCILQTTDFAHYTTGLLNPPPGSVVANAQFYTSGTPMDRFAGVKLPYAEVGGKALPEPTLAKPWARCASLEEGVLTVSGYGFPTRDKVHKADRSRYQRVKVVAKGDKCTAPVPAAVKGVGCVETTLKRPSHAADKLGGARDREEVVYTVCATRPTAATFTEVTWDGVTIVPTDKDASYDVCYCDGRECSSPKSWTKVPGSIDVHAAGYTFTAEPESLPRLPYALVNFTVTGPPFNDIEPHHWEVKVVKEVLGCSVDSVISVELYYDAPANDIDVMTFSATMGAIDLADVGKYILCLRANVTEWTALPGTVEITALEDDRTHTRNVFREQRWSVKAGGPARTLSLGGTGLPVPSDSKVALTSGATCAWSDYSFEGSAVRQPVAADTTPPMVEWSKSVPATGSAVSPATVIVLSFNELIMAPEDCLGGVHLVDSDNKKAATVLCNETVIRQNKLELDFFTEKFENGTKSYAPGKEYYVTIDSYAISDMDGNSMMRQASATGDVYKIDTGSTDTTIPIIVRTVPEKSGMLSQKLIELHFSEPVNVALTGTMDLYDCGDDFVCDASDPQVAQYIMNETNGTSIYNTTAVTVDGRSAMVDLELGVKFDLFDYRRYKLVVSAGAFYDDEENDLPEETLEFLKQPVGAGGFSRFSVLPPTASTDAGISFAAQLSADTTPGLYTLCYCDANLDTTLQDTGDKGTTYLSKPGQMTAATITGWANAALADDICETKCKAGCVGDDCFCSGYDPTDTTVLFEQIYCTSPQKCRAACDAEPLCTAFSTKENLCVLSVAGADVATDYKVGAWTSFEKQAGTACTHPHDFSTLVGKITVTGRVDVDVEYVVPPSESTTIEVSGTGLLSAEGAMLFSSDRIMVVDCDGQCGYSAPSASVSPGKPWTDLMPEQWKVDAPAEVGGPAKFKPAEYTMEPGANGLYEKIPETACFDGNLGIAALETIAMEGHFRKPSEQLCYSKCLAPGAECEGDECFCDGAYSGYDSPTSNAICADEVLCGKLCDAIEECKSFELHRDRNRCFLNKDDCGTHTMDEVQESAMYDLFVKNPDETGGRRLLPAIDPGYSHSTLLRFQGVTFASGGSFKVCFCDASLLPPGVPCTEPAHFGVEVGAVQASGISCLLQDKKYSRKTCVAMGSHIAHGGRWASDGGLRCYDGEPPDTSPPMYTDAGVEKPEELVAGEPLTDTFCLLHPEQCPDGVKPDTRRK